MTIRWRGNPRAATRRRAAIQITTKRPYRCSAHVRFISFITLSAGRSQIVSIHDLDVNRTGISSLFQDNRRSSVTPAPIRLRTAKIPCSGTVRVQTEWSGSLVDRLVMEAHQLLGPCRKHGIRSAVVIAELDFLESRLLKNK